MQKAYNREMPLKSAMAEYSLDTVLRDQELFVSELYDRHKELLAYQRKKPAEFKDALKKESIAGIRDGIEKFIRIENRQGNKHGDNLFDYSITRFLDTDLREPIQSRIADNETVRKHLTREFQHGVFDVATETIAYIVSEEYRTRVQQLHLGEIKPRASQTGTA